jgi:hypothetical protein
MQAGSEGPYLQTKTQNGVAQLLPTQIQQLVNTLLILRAQGINKDDERYCLLLRILHGQSFQTSDPKSALLTHSKPLSSSEQHRLKAQIQCYKLLSRNLPVSPELIRAISPLSSDDNSTHSLYQFKHSLKLQN